jgi:hypothetical protein
MWLPCVETAVNMRHFMHFVSYGPRRTFRDIARKEMRRNEIFYITHIDMPLLEVLRPLSGREKTLRITDKAWMQVKTCLHDVYDIYY